MHWIADKLLAFFFYSCRIKIKCKSISQGFQIINYMIEIILPHKNNEDMLLAIVMPNRNLD